MIASRTAPAGRSPLQADNRIVIGSISAPRDNHKLWSCSRPSSSCLSCSPSHAGAFPNGLEDRLPSRRMRSAWRSTPGSAARLAFADSGVASSTFYRLGDGPSYRLGGRTPYRDLRAPPPRPALLPILRAVAAIDSLISASAKS